MPSTTKSSLSLDIIQRLEPLSHAYRFLPIGGGTEGKAPLVKNWPHYPGSSIGCLASWPRVKSIGVITGPSLLCFDFDGQSALEKAIKVHGLNPDGVRTWRINRDNDPHRLKLIFRPTDQQLAELPDRQITSSEATKPKAACEVTGRVISKGEAIEVFLHPARQVIVAGDHPSSGGVYLWPENQGPERLVPPPADWWNYVLKKSRDYPQPAAGAHRTVRSGDSSSKDWHRLDICPVCGRGPSDNPVCQIHRDGETLRCFVGSTFAPPLDLAPGQLAPGTEWAYSSQSSSGWGDFLTFVKDKPSPFQSLQNWLNK